METILKGKNIEYLECNRGGLHDGEQLNQICLDPSCEKNRLLCAICNLEDHKDHQKNIIPLKKFLVLIQTKLEKAQTINFNADEILENLEQNLQLTLYSLKQSVQVLAEQIKNLEKSVQNCYQVTKQRIISQALMSENMPKVVSSLINGDFSNIPEMQQNCKSLVESIQYQNNQITLDFNPQGVFKKFCDINKGFQEKNHEYTDQFKANFNSLIEILEKAKNKEDFIPGDGQNMAFSKDKKSTTINLSEQNQVATQTSDGEKRYALAEKPLSSTEISYVAFKIKKLAGWVGIGIAVDDILKPKAYGFSQYTSVGHGAWLISSNNYIWSNCTIEENQKSQSFAFKTDDIILLKYDPLQNKLQFKKKDQKLTKVTTLKIQGINKGKPQLYPCANLCQKNDAVQFLEWQESYKF